MVATPTPRIPFEGCPLCNDRTLHLLRTADCSAHPLYQPVHYGVSERYRVCMEVIARRAG